MAKVFDADAADAEAILGGGGPFAVSRPTCVDFGFLFERGAGLVNEGTFFGARFDDKDFVGLEGGGDGAGQVLGHADEDGFELDLELFFDEVDLACAFGEGLFYAVGVGTEDDLNPVRRELGADVLTAEVAVVGFPVPGVPGFIADGGVEVLEEEVLVFGVAFAPDVDAAFFGGGTGVRDFVFEFEFFLLGDEAVVEGGDFGFIALEGDFGGFEFGEDGLVAVFDGGFFAEEGVKFDGDVGGGGGGCPLDFGFAGLAFDGVERGVLDTVANAELDPLVGGDGGGGPEFDFLAGKGGRGAPGGVL